MDEKERNSLIECSIDVLSALHTLEDHIRIYDKANELGGCKFLLSGVYAKLKGVAETEIIEEKI